MVPNAHWDSSLTRGVRPGNRVCALCQVLGQRRPLASSLLLLEDEIYLLLSAILEAQSHRTTEGSFAESLYGEVVGESIPIHLAGPTDPDTAAGLKRVPHASNSSPRGPGEPSTSGGGRRLSDQQRQASVLLLVYLPYLRSKLDAIYHEYREQIALEDEVAAARGETRAAPPGTTPLLRRVAEALRRRLGSPQRALVSVYPWTSFAWEAFRFAYQVAYLLDRSQYFSPELHLLGLKVSRITQQDAADLSREGNHRINGRREWLQRRLSVLLPAPLSKLIAGGLSSAGENARRVVNAGP